MAQLIVRNIEHEVVKELKKRAAEAGHSAEEEHRRILRDALVTSSGRASLKELLEQMPALLSDELERLRSGDLGRDIDL